MKLLVVGGAGYVASIIRPSLEARFDCRYFDRRTVAGAEERTIVGDVNDPEKITQAVEGIDAIVYLAMGVQTGDPQTVRMIDLAFAVNVQAL